MTDNPSIKQKLDLLREFDKSAARIVHLLVLRYGEDEASRYLPEARKEFENLIPYLPNLGGKQPFTRFITATGWFLAIYRVLMSHGQSLEEAGQLVYDASETYLKAVPGFARRFLGFMSFSPGYLKKLQLRAEESQQHISTGDYVYTFVEGDGKTFDYGVDYTECAGCKFLESQGAPELAPYLCAVDKLYSDLLGWGLMRTMTLADGHDKCDFRFKKGGVTNVAIPASLKITGS